jgi:ribosomal-protein-alanine N-acetyltransferase
MSCDDILVREYRDSDFEVVLEMESSRGGDPYYHAVFIRQMAFLFPKTFLIAQKTAGDTVGYILGGFNSDEPKSGLVMRIFVLPAFRRSGFGWILMEELERELLRSGVGTAVLTVSPSNEGAIGLYKKLGYSSSGCISDYFGEGEDRIFMTAPLNRKRMERPY